MRVKVVVQVTVDQVALQHVVESTIFQTLLSLIAYTRYL